jgi:hypothetical protein
MAREEKELGSSRKGHSEKTIVLFILILGIIIGGIIATYALYPEMNKTLIKENQGLKEKNALLEKEANSLVKCMQENGINYYTQCK